MLGWRALLLSTFVAFCLYIYFAVDHGVLKNTLAAFGRIALAAVGVGAGDGRERALAVIRRGDDGLHRFPALSGGVAR